MEKVRVTEGMNFPGDLDPGLARDLHGPTVMDVDPGDHTETPTPTHRLPNRARVAG